MRIAWLTAGVLLSSLGLSVGAPPAAALCPSWAAALLDLRPGTIQPGEIHWYMHTPQELPDNTHSTRFELTGFGSDWVELWVWDDQGGVCGMTSGCVGVIPGVGINTGPVSYFSCTVPVGTHWLMVRWLDSNLSMGGHAVDYLLTAESP